MKKICIVTLKIPPDYSGAGKRAYNHASYLAKENYCVTVLSRSNTFIDSRELKLISFRKPYKKKNIYLLNALMSLTFHGLLLVKLIRLMIKNNYKIIHCFGLSSWFSYLAILAGKITGKTVLSETTLYGSDDPLSIQKSRVGHLKFKIINMSDIIIAISPLLFDVSIKSGIPARKVKLIHNGVNTEIFKPLEGYQKDKLKKRFGFSNVENILITVGVVSPRKRIDLIVDYFYKINEKYKSSTLIIVGMLPDRHLLYYQDLVVKINNYGLADKVVFTGNVQNVDEWLKISDIFLFASESEGFGNSIIEAMSSALPVVSLKISGITNYIINHMVDGIIVDNDKDFITKSLELLDNRELQQKIACNARNKVLKRFSEDVVMAKYQELYNQYGITKRKI